MGKAAREKRRRHEESDPASFAPIWAGANGFNAAWEVVRDQVTAGKGWVGDNESDIHTPADWERALRLTENGLALADIKVNILRGMMHRYVKEDRGYDADQVTEALDNETPQRYASRKWLPKTYAEGVTILGREHQRLLERTTPLLFDPLLNPDLEPSAFDRIKLPFPVVTCDFLSDHGMCMPIKADDNNNHWVGLIAATITEPHPHTFDIWPVVTVLDPASTDRYQPIKPCSLGWIRFGENSPLPEAPPGLLSMDLDTYGGEEWAHIGKYAWILPDEHNGGVSTDVADLKISVAEHPITTWDQIYGGTMVLQPAAAALGALTLLEAANVEITESAPSRGERRRIMARHGSFVPAKEVIIRHKHTRKEETDDVQSTGSIDWQHRWTVRGHWKHFTKGRFFEANPRRRVMDPEHGECIKVWCPPFVKGPEGMPLVLKSRRVID